MNNGLKTAAVLSVSLMFVCLMFVPASSAASDRNVGYGEGEGIAVEYYDDDNGFEGNLDIIIDSPSSLKDPFFVSIGGVESAALYKDMLNGNVLMLSSAAAKLPVGETLVTLRDSNGYSLSAVVNVGPEAESVSLNKTTVDLVPGGTTVLRAIVSPADAVYKTIQWESSDSSVATVDSDGKVIAVSGGSAVITARTGELSGSCTVKVIAGDEYYDLTFVNGYGGVLSSVSYKAGAAISAPEDPIREGYSFNGWVPDVPATMPAKDLTISASWVKEFVDGDTQVKIEEHSVTDENGETVDVEEITSTTENCKTTTVIKQDGTNSAQQTITVNADSTVSKSAIDQALVQAEKDLGRSSSEVTAVNKTVALKTETSDEVEIEASAVKSVGDSDSKLSVATASGSVVFDKAVCDTIGSKTGTMSLTVNDDKTKLTNDKVKNAIGENRFIALNLSVGDGSEVISQLGGAATVSFQCDITPGKIAKLYYVDDDGVKDSAEIEYEYENGTMTFSTTHFSVFMVEEQDPPAPESEGGDGGINPVIIGAVVGVLAIVALVAVVMLRKR